MKQVAIIFTVFNRKEITIDGLCKLFPIINSRTDCNFELFMTDDGCTDGTSEAVRAQFPSVHIVEGDGSLFWSGGMRKAWKAASDFADFDYYIWYNDDALLYSNAISLLFDQLFEYGENTIVGGVFCDHEGKVSYGGRNKNNKLIEPGENDQVYFINGNLVLVTKEVYKKLGNIDHHFIHGLGDWDYGLRAIENGINVVLTKEYVGETDRHDNDLVQYANSKFNLRNRISKLYSLRNAPNIKLYFNFRHGFYLKGIHDFLYSHYVALFPKF